MRLPDASILDARHARVRAALDALALDALVVTSLPNVRYLTNHVGSAGALVVTASAMHLLVDSRYVTAVDERQHTAAACPSLRVWQVPASQEEALVGCLVEIGVTSVGFEARHMSVAQHEWLSRTLEARGAGVALRSTERVIEALRAVKDAAEIATLTEAAGRLTTVAQRAVEAARAGRTELDVAAAIDQALRAAGYERAAFDTIVASGPHAALPHHRATDRVLADGELVVLDFGGVLDGYCCDLTRTVSIGPPSAEAQRVYDAVRDAQHAAIEAVRPGVTTADVDAAARNVLESRGLGEAFGHGTGHGLGLEVHEEPRITRPRADVAPVPLAPGMVFTVEPGAYLPGWGGVRIEDDVLVTETGARVLTSAVPRSLSN